MYTKVHRIVGVMNLDSYYDLHCGLENIPLFCGCIANQNVDVRAEKSIDIYKTYRYLLIPI